MDDQITQELRAQLAQVEARELQTLRDILAHIDPEACCIREGGPSEPWPWPWRCRNDSGRLVGTGTNERGALVLGICGAVTLKSAQAREVQASVAQFVTALDGLRRFA